MSSRENNTNANEEQLINTNEEQLINTNEENAESNYERRGPLLSCAICLENILDEPLFTPCIHGFHKDCLNTWIQVKKQYASIPCPTCKTNIREMVPELNMGGDDNGIPLNSFLPLLHIVNHMGINRHFGQGTNQIPYPFMNHIVRGPAPAAPTVENNHLPNYNAIPMLPLHMLNIINQPIGLAHTQSNGYNEANDNNGQQNNEQHNEQQNNGLNEQNNEQQNNAPNVQHHEQHNGQQNNGLNEQHNGPFNGLMRIEITYNNDVENPMDLINVLLSRYNEQYDDQLD